MSIFLLLWNNYVIDLDSRVIYQSTEKIETAVLNLYAELMPIADRQLKDYSERHTKETHVSFILRPLKYGIETIKRLERVVLRCFVINLKSPDGSAKPVVSVHCSGDGINFVLLKGILLNNGSYKDLDMGMFARSKFRQYILSFGGTIDDNSQISLLETQIDKEYTNSKLR